MEFSDYLVYVDESGDHNLNSIDRDYPMFVLACCIFEKQTYCHIIVPAIQAFKFEFFGHDAVVLHEHEIRKQKKPFIFLKNPEKREHFMNGLNTIIEKSPFVLVASAIHKGRHRDRYVEPASPYDIALTFCVERVYAFLKDKKQGQRLTHIMVERRGKKEDDELELTFRRVCDGANRWGRIDCVDIVFVDKRHNSSGLQLADLVARPIGRHVLDPQQPNRAYEILSQKFRRSPTGQCIGWGLKIFPPE